MHKNKLEIFSSKGLVSLDLLRSIAAWLVAVPHFFLFSNVNSEILEFISIFAVEIFFVLSGFVLGGQLDLCFEKRNFNTLKVFFLRRWSRTIPIFFVVLFLLAVVNDNIFEKSFIEYLTFTFSFLSYEENNNFFMAAWSLAVEEWFYIIFPLILVASAKFNISKFKIIILFVAVIFILKIINHTMYEINFHRITLFRLDAIVIGYLCYLFLKKRSLKTINRNLIFLCFILSLTISFYSFAERFLLLFILFSSSASVFILMLIQSFEEKVKRSNFSKKFFGFFANTSYCIYLCHTLVFQLFFGNSLLNISNFFLYVIVCIAFAVLSFYMIERPFLLARPSYNDDLIRNIHYRFSNITNIIIANIVIFIVLICSLEFISKRTINFYNKLNVPNLEKVKKDVSFKNNKDRVEDLNPYTDEIGLKRDIGNYKGPIFSSYLSFKNRPYESEYLNINEDGIRVNNRNLLINKTDKIIWLFGSSAVYGATNPDNETIAAELEKVLNKNSNLNYRVINMAVDGYNSLQDYINFKIRLAENSYKPDLVIVINGYNDFYKAAMIKNTNSELLIDTWGNTSEILGNAWKAGQSNNIINYVMLEQKINNFFPNTIKIIELLKKLINLKINNFFIETFKEEYKTKSKKFSNIYSRNLKVVNNFYKENMNLFITKAKDRKIKLILIQQPMLFTSRKMLVGSEENTYFHKNLEFFSLPEKKLDSLKKIPSYEINRKFYLNKYDFIDGYIKQQNLLKDLANERRIQYLELNDILLSIDNKPIFTSMVHFSHQATKIISRKLYQHIKEKNY